MDLTHLAGELRRIFADPESLTRRQGAEFACGLYEFLQLPAAAGSSSQLWSLRSAREADAEPAETADSRDCPEALVMKQFDKIARQELVEMSRDLLNRSQSTMQTDSEQQLALVMQFLKQMNQQSQFAKVMRACMSPMKWWLDTSVLMGHRTFCLADQMRKFCLDHYLSPVAVAVSCAAFRTVHCGETSHSVLHLVEQYVLILQQYQRFQAYLTAAGFLSGPYDGWEGDSGGGGGGGRTVGETELLTYSLASAFVQPYLDCLTAFYRPHLQPFNAHRVVESVTAWVEDEAVLAAACPIEGFRDSVVTSLLREAVQNHLDAFGTSVRQLLLTRDCQTLGRFCCVMSMVDNGLSHLLEDIRCFVRDQMLGMFASVRTKFESLDPNSAKATSLYIDGCVAQLRSCTSTIDALDLNPSLNKNRLLSALKTGFCEVLNRNSLVEAIRHPASYPAVALAHHFHRQMRAIEELNADSKEVVADLMTLYDLLLDKEVFLMRYQNLLRERLLSDGHPCLEAETFALENLTRLSGSEAVYQVKSMLKDFKESEAFNETLSSREEHQAIQRGLFGSLVPVRFSLVRGYFWHIAEERVRLPQPLADLVESVIEVYQSMHSGRVVNFVYSSGSAVLSFTPARQPQQDRELLLRCSGGILILLLNFNDSDALTKATLRERTGIQDADLTFYLHHLVRTGLLLLHRAEGGEVYTVNEDFWSDAKLVNLMVHAQKQQRRQEKLDLQMKEMRLQCALVAVMKQASQLTRRNLLQMVQLRLSESPLDVNLFAAQLDSLISREFIKVASHNDDDVEESVLEYVP